MREYTPHTRTLTTHAERRSCSLCGDSFGRAYGQDDGRIHVAFGERYPGGDTREHVEADVCRDCFDETVAPALRALGVRLWRWGGGIEDRHEAVAFAPRRASAAPVGVSDD